MDTYQDHVPSMDTFYQVKDSRLLPNLHEEILSREIVGTTSPQCDLRNTMENF